MAYTGNDSYERQIYDKLVEAGVSDNDANTMARIEATRQKESGFLTGCIREDRIGGFISWLRNKI